MTLSEFKKLAKENNKRIAKEIKSMQSGITEGKNSNQSIIKLISN